MTEATLRIGELSRRVGVSPELLRAWERRYGLLQPSRTDGGFRLYSVDDVARVRRMRRLLDQGLAASEAAQLARAGEPAPQPSAVADTLLEHRLGELTATLDGYDEAGAHRALDAALAAFGLDTVLGGLVLPYLRELGERWERGEVSVAQEHFASHLIRGRLLGLARGWGRGAGPKALLACPPEELHDLPLVIFGLALRSHGWRITFLGADTPLATVQHAAQEIDPDLVVLAATERAGFEAVAAELTELAASWRLAVAGRGAGPELAERVGADHLDADLVGAAAAVAGAR